MDPGGRLSGPVPAAAGSPMPRKTPDLEGYIAPGSEEEPLVREIDFSRLPAHVAIIMDGNGRWAQSRRLPRVAGHKAGIEAVRDIVEASARLGLKVLTLYAFSKENWKRPRTEINVLMALLKEYLHRELNTLIRNDIRFNVIGRMEELEGSVQRELRRGMDKTRDLQGMIFNIALSYGGRAEIVDACRSLVREIGAGRRPRLRQTYDSTEGSRWAKLPTAPEIFPTAIE
mgnify:CR=1 FL=1